MLRFITTLFVWVALAAAQDDSAALLSKATELHKAGQYPAAIDAYREYLKVRPEAAWARANLGAALAHEGRFAEAIKEYRTAVEAEPSNQGMRFNLGVTYYRAGEYAQAAEELEKVQSAEGADSATGVKSAILLADCYRRQGEDKKLIALLDPVVEKYPENPAASYLLGTALLRENQDERGKHILDQMMSRGDSAEVRLMLAITKMRGSGDLKGALEDIQRCLELKPNLAEAHVVHGRILLMTGDQTGAEAAFRKALAADPGTFDALLELGAIERQQGKADAAVATLKQALALRSGDVPARYQLALADSALGNDAQAVELLEGVVKDTPGFLEAHARLSNLYFRLHRAEDARREKVIADGLRAEGEKRELERKKRQQ